MSQVLDLDLPWLESHQPLPPAQQAWPEHAPYPGLLAAGGDLSVPRLVDAYSRGIFPWFSEGEPILWWSTDPRMVLAPHDFKLHTSLRKQLKTLLREQRVHIDIDTHFTDVITTCADVARQDQAGTWIGPSMQQAYAAMFEAGYAHCISAWVDGVCVGGLYGINIGSMVFGESMFSLAPNGSKIALAALVALSRRDSVTLIDCQQVTPHLASLGGAPIARSAFLNTVEQACSQPAPTWVFQTSDWQYLDTRLL